MKTVCLMSVLAVTVMGVHCVRAGLFDSVKRFANDAVDVATSAATSTVGYVKTVSNTPLITQTNVTASAEETTHVKTASAEFVSGRPARVSDKGDGETLVPMQTSSKRMSAVKEASQKNKYETAVAQTKKKGKGKELSNEEMQKLLDLQRENHEEFLEKQFMPLKRAVESRKKAMRFTIWQDGLYSARQRKDCTWKETNNVPWKVFTDIYVYNHMDGLRYDKLCLMTDGEVLKCYHNGGYADQDYQRWKSDAECWLGGMEKMLKRHLLINGEGVERVRNLHCLEQKDGDAAWKPFMVYKTLTFGSIVADIHELLAPTCKNECIWTNRESGDGAGGAVGEYINGKRLCVENEQHKLDFRLGSFDIDEDGVLVELDMSFVSNTPDVEVLLKKYSGLPRASEVTKITREIAIKWPSTLAGNFWETTISNIDELKSKSAKDNGTLGRLDDCRAKIISKHAIVEKEEIALLRVDGILVEVHVAKETGKVNYVHLVDEVLSKELKKRSIEAAKKAAAQATEEKERAEKAAQAAAIDF